MYIGWGVMPDAGVLMTVAVPVYALANKSLGILKSDYVGLVTMPNSPVGRVCTCQCGVTS